MARAAACRGLRLLGESRTVFSLWSLPRLGALGVDAGADSMPGPQRYCPAQTSVLVGDAGLPATVPLRSPRTLSGSLTVPAACSHVSARIHAPWGQALVWVVVLSLFHHSI